MRPDQKQNISSDVFYISCKEQNWIEWYIVNLQVWRIHFDDISSSVYFSCYYQNPLDLDYGAFSPRVDSLLLLRNHYDVQSLQPLSHKNTRRIPHEAPFRLYDYMRLSSLWRSIVHAAVIKSSVYIVDFASPCIP